MSASEEESLMKREGRWAVGPIGCSLAVWGAGKYQRLMVPFGKVLQEWQTRYGVKQQLSLRHHRYELQRPKKLAIALPKVVVHAITVNAWRNIAIPAKDRPMRFALVFCSCLLSVFLFRMKIRISKI